MIYLTVGLCLLLLLFQCKIRLIFLKGLYHREINSHSLYCKLGYISLHKLALDWCHVSRELSPCAQLELHVQMYTNTYV